MKHRVLTLRLTLLGIGILFAGRLFYVQVISHESYRAQAQSEQLKKYEIAADRGRIYFEDYRKERVPAVLNQSLKTLYADPRYIDHPAQTAQQLVTVIGGNVHEIEELLSDSERAYVVIQKKLSTQKVEAIEELELVGIGLQDASYRSYPEGSLASQILGFTNNDGIGQYGLEEAYNDKLAGTPGLLNAVTDVNGIPLTTAEDSVLVDAVDGRDVVLTIDQNVQKYAEDALKRGVKSSGAKTGSIVVLDPRNGQIRAMASFPSYNPAEFSTVKDARVFLNNVVSTPYEVGSVIKPFTMAMGLNEGKVRPDSTYFDAGSVQVDDRKIENAIAITPATRDMTEVVTQSLNTGMVHVLQQFGGGSINEASRASLYDYFVHKFGFTQLTGVEQAAEAAGVIFKPTDQEGNNVRYANMTFGQGMTMTMLQLASAYGALINGGDYYRPYLVSATVDKLTEQEEVIEPTLLRSAIISRDTSAAIRSMMEAGVKLAGAAGGHRTDYRVGGKTGTSQKLQADGTYSESLETGTFIGFGGGESPEYVVVTKVDEPTIPGFAGSVAARPIFADMSNWLINYYRISPIQ